MLIRSSALEDAGAAAAVLPSLFEEQIEHDEQEVNKLYEYQTESFAESLSHFPELELVQHRDEGISGAAGNGQAKVQIPLIGSLNGASTGGWTSYAKSMVDAGADAMELNIYFIPTDPKMTAADVEKHYADLVAAVKETDLRAAGGQDRTLFHVHAGLLKQFEQDGADGLVLFNRFLEPDIDLETLQVSPNLVLSSRHELRLALRWIAILSDQTDISIAATGGVHFADDVIKALLAGADVSRWPPPCCATARPIFTSC